jgi:hypothetical protein
MMDSMLLRKLHVLVQGAAKRSTILLNNTMSAYIGGLDSLGWAQTRWPDAFQAKIGP